MEFSNNLTEEQIRELRDVILTELGGSGISYRMVAVRCMEIFENIPGFEGASDRKQQETIDEVWKHVSER